jgi:hypothetical protein
MFWGESEMTSVIAEWPASSGHLDKLFEAKSKALGAMKNAPRTSKSHFGKYADLATVIDTIRKPLADNGLDVIQCFVPYDENYVMLVTTLGHSSGQFIRSFLPIKASLQPQQLAATATYLKRVELAAIVGCAAEDEDDGDTAQRAAIASAITDEPKIEKALIANIRAAKDEVAVQSVLGRVERGVEGGQLSAAAAERVRLVAADCVAKFAKPSAKKEQREPVAAS